MTTSGITTWSLTGNDLVKAAMQELALLSPGEEPDASESEDVLLRLNGLLKSWAVRGGNLFREAAGTVTIPAGSASGQLGAGIRSISSARVRVSATQERQLQPFNRSQYMNLPNKLAKGQPSLFYFADSGNTATMYVWPVPAASTTVLIDYSRVAETITHGAQTLDIPEEWQEAVWTNLAVRIAPLFGDAQLSGATAARARELEVQLLDSDRPDSYYFESSGYGYGG